MNYKHLVFDVDGTLLDTALCILQSLHDALITKTGSSPEISDLEFALGNPSVATMKQLNVPDPESTIALWVEYENRYKDMIVPFEGISDLIRFLSEKGYQLGIATSRTREELDLVFQHLSISPLFTTVICSDDTARPKPSPEPLLKYMEITSAAPEELLYIGDNLHDLQCASAAGVDFALASWGTRMSGDGAKYCPASPSELMSILVSETED